MSTSDCIITLDKNLLQLAGIGIDQLKHPANYATNVTTTPKTQNNGTINTDFDLTLGKYITIKIKRDDKFSIIKNNIDTETYTYVCNSLDILFTVPNDNTIYNDQNNHQFFIPETNKTLKFVYDKNATMTSPTTTNNSYTLHLDTGVVDIVYIIPKTDNSYKNKDFPETISEPSDKHMNTINNFISDLFFDLFIVIIGWICIINLTTRWFKVDADNMYPIDVNNPLYCKNSSVINKCESVLNYKREINEANVIYPDGSLTDITLVVKSNSEYNFFSIFNEGFESFKTFFETKKKNIEFNTWFDIYYTLSKNVHLCYRILNSFHSIFYSIYSKIPEEYYKTKSVFLTGLLFAFYYYIKPDSNIRKKYININNVKDIFLQKFIYILITFIQIFSPLFFLLLVSSWVINIKTTGEIMWSLNICFWPRIAIYSIWFIVLIFSLPYLITFLSFVMSKIYKNKKVDSKVISELLKPSTMSSLILLIPLIPAFIISSIFSFGTIYHLLFSFKTDDNKDKNNNSLFYYIVSLILTLLVIILMRVYELDKKILFPIMLVAILVIGSTFVFKYLS